MGTSVWNKSYINANFQKTGRTIRDVCYFLYSLKQGPRPLTSTIGLPL